MAKIVARTQDGYLVDMTSSELANLVGYFYSESDGCPAFQAGDELQISQMYKQLYFLENHQDKLSRVARDLREYADHLDHIKPVVFPQPKTKGKASDD